MGRSPSREHCVAVLKTGNQRQRVAAGHYLFVIRHAVVQHQRAGVAAAALLAEMK